MSAGSTPNPNVVQTQQTSDPWSGAQPALTQAIGGAQNLYAGDVGYQPYPGQTQANINPALEQGLGGVYTKAMSQYGGPASVNAALGLTTDMMQNQGLSAGQRNTVIPAMQGLGQQYGNIYNEASGQQNPYLLQQLAAQDRRISDKVNSSMSGAGRYGSGAHTDVLGRSLAEASYPVLAQDYAQRQATRLAASQGGQGVQRDINDIYSGGLNRAGQYAAMAPGLENAAYMPYDRLMGYGQYYQDRSQQALNDQITQYNAGQARPWEQVARLNAIGVGGGQLGGTVTKYAPSTTPPLSSRIIGGGIAGAGLGSIFGAPGAAIGGLGGAGLGAFGY